MEKEQACIALVDVVMKKGKVNLIHADQNKKQQQGGGKLREKKRKRI